MTSDEWRGKTSPLVTRHILESCCDRDATNLGELQRVLVSATRCLDCADPRCLNTCPKHVDVRAAMRLIVDRTGARHVAWAQREDEATRSVMGAIVESHES